MAEPKTDKQKQKQKIMIGAVVVVVLVVGYQVVKMLGGGGDVTPTTVPTPGAKTMSASAAPATAAGGSSSAMTATPSSAPSPAPSESTQPKQAPVQGNTALLKLQQETQTKYIAALNELQMLKLQKDIAETKQAITSSTLATATAEKNITDLLTVQQAAPPTAFGNMAAPTAPAMMPPMPGQQSAQSSPMGGSGTGNAAPMPAPAPVQQKPTSSPDAPYTLLSVSFEGNRWTAVLSFQDKMYNVAVGDSLPPDGSVVDSIGREGVSLKKDKETRKITMMASL